MANLNLSQFTEKTFVADADWVFVWDTAGAISKKVSRNSLLNSGTLTTSAPVTISQTWNDAAIAFTAFKVNAVSTASASGSLLLDLQVGGVSTVSFRKDGLLSVANSGTSTLQASFGNWTASGELRVSLGCSAGGYFSLGTLGAADTYITRDAANTLALRNGAAAQTFNVYGTYTSGSAYARLAIACDTSGNATLTTQSTGTAGTVSINGVPVGLGKGLVSTNVALGTGALNANTTGSRNTVIGNDALLSGAVGLANVAIGYSALKLAIGSQTGNTAIGDQALQNCVTSGYNTALGQGAGFSITGSVNLTSSQNSVFLGALTSANGNAETNQIVIGYNATGLGSNSVVLGNASITTTALRGNVGIGTTAPTSKLQVTGGDVEIETVTSGIIMKAAGTSTRYRITLNAGGTALVFTAI